MTRSITDIQADMRRARRERNEDWYRRLWQEKRRALVAQMERTGTNGRRAIAK